VVDDDVGEGDQPAHEVDATRVVEVEAEALLAAHERPREPAAPIAEVEAPAALHLDHLGAEIAEETGGHRPGDHPGEIEHADPVERAHQPSSASTWASCSPRRGGRATRQGASPRRKGAPG